MRRRILLAASVANPVVAVESQLDEVGVRYMASRGVEELHERLDGKFVEVHTPLGVEISHALEVAKSLLIWIASVALQQYAAPWETNLMAVAALMRQISLLRTVRHTENLLFCFLSPKNPSGTCSRIRLTEKKIGSVIISAIKCKRDNKITHSKWENLLLLQSAMFTALTDSLFPESYLYLESMIFDTLASGGWSANEVQSAFKRISGSQLCLLLRSTKEIVRAVDCRLSSQVTEQIPVLSEHFNERSLQILRPLWLLFMLLRFLPDKKQKKKLYQWFKRYTKKSEFAREHLRHLLPLLDTILFNKKIQHSAFRRKRKISLGTPAEFLTFISAITKKVIDEIKTGSVFRELV